MFNNRLKGILLVVIGGALWGISGTVVQYLFEYHQFTPEWLVVVRLVISGLILLAWAYQTYRQKVWAIWKDKRDALSLLLFSILGTLAVPYTYFVAIHHGNAATATVLQYTAPVLIAGYLTLRHWRLPGLKECIAIVLAILGTFLLVTKGSFTSLSISGLALFWGLSSAVALAFYTIQPKRLLDKWGSTIIVGWGMLIGGFCFSFIYPPWDIAVEWTLPNIIAVVFIVIFGTLIAYYFYLDSLKYLSASEASLSASVEPLSAVVTSIIWLKLPFSLMEWIGALCIISTIIILSLVKKDSDADVDAKHRKKITLVNRQELGRGIK